MRLTPAEEQVPCGQQYAVGVVQWFLGLVLNCGASLRCAAEVLERLGQATDSDAITPHWTTGRLWLQRIGLAALLQPKVIAPDWAWIVDHSIQIGQVKCLVILGIRLSELPAGRPLCYEDLELIGLKAMTHATRQTVAESLEEAVAQTGVPRVILDDHGVDLHGGVEIFRAEHPSTSEVYDIKHKAACLLKARLGNDPLWNGYTSQLGQTKFALQQTELACLTPPSPRSKSRFMNLAELVEWGIKTLAVLGDGPGLESLGISADRAQEKLGWLEAYREPLWGWWSCHRVIAAVLEFVRSEGLYVRASVALEQKVPAASGDAGVLREELIEFVMNESAKARPGERLPGTTEVLESCFGKLKALESSQSKSGFTGLVLSLGAVVSKWTTARLGEALRRCRVSDVWRWCREHLGESVQSQRRQAYARPAGATNSG